MGIEGLKGNNSLIKKFPNCLIKIKCSELRNKRIAVDVMWMARACRSTANNEVLAETDLRTDKISELKITKLWLRRFAEFITDMYSHEILPVFVFDGKPPIEKTETLKKRREDEKSKREKIFECEEKLFGYWNATSVLEIAPNNIIEEYTKLLKNNSNIPRGDFDILKQVFKYFGCPYIQAPSEAEKLCSSMVIDGLVTAIYTTDTDVLAHGAPLMFNNYNRYEKTFEGIRVDVIREECELHHDEFIEFCILSGCDYNDGVKGIGPVSALKLIKKYKCIELIKDSKITDLSLIKAELCRSLFKYEPAKDMCNFDFDKLTIDMSFLNEGIDFLQHYELDKYLEMLTKNSSNLSFKNEDPQNRTLGIKKVIKYVPIRIEDGIVYVN